MALTLRKPTMVITKPVLLKKPVKSYSIPDSMIEPETNLEAYSYLIYGPKKIGKSTLASLFSEAIFFMFEPGAKALRIYRMDCNKWEDALGYLSALEKQKESGTLRFKTCVIDTGFEMSQKATRFVCDELGIEYPREDNFGKDWDKIKQELRRFHDRLFALGLGTVVLCHETVKEHQTYSGNKYDKIIPLLPRALDDYYRAVIDNVMWYHYRGKERFLQIKGTDAAMAGMALQADEFFKTKSGEAIFAIPIPSDTKNGMKAILSAFNNEQNQSFKDESEKQADAYIKASVSDKLRKEQQKAKRQAR